jgi:hypothetical protein
VHKSRTADTAGNCVEDLMKATENEELQVATAAVKFNKV